MQRRKQAINYDPPVFVTLPDHRLPLNELLLADRRALFAIFCDAATSPRCKVFDGLVGDERGGDSGIAGRIGIRLHGIAAAL